MSFLQFHAIAATRGDGLRPELKALLEQHAVAPSRNGIVQSEPEANAKPFGEIVRRIRLASPSMRRNARRGSQPST